MADRRKISLAKKSAATTLVALSALSFSSFDSQKVSAAGMGVSATLNIFAEIVRALEITINTSLDFGVLAITEDRAGKASIDPITDKLVIEGSSALAQAGGVPRAGRVRIKGIFAPVTLSMEETSIKLTNGSTSITVHDFNFGNGASQVTVTPPGVDNPTATVAVGATVSTKVGQLDGVYTGSNRVFANYQ